MSHPTASSGNSNLPSYARETAPLHGILAEYDGPTPLMQACEKVRDAGYTCWDAHTPFPVHGLDNAMGMRPTRLPWAVLGSGILGLCLALLMQWWMNSIDYAFIISGKPLFSLPAFVPVCFELTVLFSAFMCFFGTLGRNGLPELFHPLALKERFRRATNDRFFIYIEAKDPQFDEARVKRLLTAGAVSTEVVHYEPHGLHTHLPQGTVGIAAILSVAALLPIAMFARARESTSEKPRIHASPPAPVKDDMDIQFKFKPQTTNWFFTDNRAMRPFPHGAVADEDPVVMTSYLTGKMAAQSAPKPPELEGTSKKAKTSQAKAHVDAQAPKDAAGAAASGFLAGLPPEVVPSQTLMARGQEHFRDTCAVCHGAMGHGDGLVARHAEALNEGTWVAPTNLHEERVRNLPLGDIYNTVTHGIRNMPGYGHLIMNPQDRWGIVMYVKALQLSQHAPQSAVPDDVLPTLK